ncbi:hypothetical protein JKA73_17830 [Myxococcus xanthus]|uniref:hypothetical protein n=1 Tax=Myxococcus xanthus TaxID=34 RepID=UPI001917764F|nr:hypothetical protein [Myxococcus xanthus]QQR47795.1 hypothetical protein JKA73_17830 [Myxococcus xanthus]
MDAHLQGLLERLLLEVQALRGGMDKPLPTVLTKKRAAEELSVSLSKLKAMIRSGEILVCEVGSTTGVPSSEIRRIAAARSSVKAPRPSGARARSSRRATSPTEEAAQVRAALRKQR